MTQISLNAGTEVTIPNKYVIILFYNLTDTMTIQQAKLIYYNITNK